MKMPGNKRFLVVLSAFAVLLAGCANSLDERPESKDSGEFGSIRVYKNAESVSSRAYNLSDFKTARIEVTGYDMTAVDPVSVTMSNGSGSFTVENIPVGKNRIITVWAQDENDTKLGSSVVRKVQDISAGGNTVVVNADSTALANVFASLLDGAF